MVFAIDSGPEFIGREHCWIHRARQRTFGISKDGGKFGEGNGADHHQIDIAARPLRGDGQGAKNESYSYAVPCRLQSLAEDIHNAYCFGQHPGQFRKNRAGGVGSKVYAVAVPRSPEDPGLRQELQFSLEARGTHREVASQFSKYQGRSGCRSVADKIRCLVRLSNASIRRDLRNMRILIRKIRTLSKLQKEITYGRTVAIREFRILTYFPKACHTSDLCCGAAEACTLM